MTDDEFEALWQETQREFVARAKAKDSAGVLWLADAWLARWRGVEPIPHASTVVYLATWGPLWAESTASALAYADAAASLADRADEPNSSRVIGWVVEAYANITESTERVEQTRVATAAARRFAMRITSPHQKVDAHLARALRNLAVDEESLDVRLALVEEIRQLSARHAGSVHDIDEHLSAAIVCLSRSLGRGTAKHVELIDELGTLHDRWPTSVEIAAVYVAETWNAYVTDGLEAEPEQLIARFESIQSGLAESHEDIERALGYLRAELDQEPESNL